MEESFIQAINHENVENLSQIINSDFYYDNEKVLMHACKNNKINNVTLLLDSGADINAKGGEPLLSSIQNGNEELLCLLINRGVDLSVLNKTDFKDLHNPKIAKILIDNGLEIKDQYLFNAVESGNLEIVKLLVTTDFKFNLFTAFENSLRKNQYEIAKFLLKIGVDLSTYDSKITCETAKNGFTEILKLLADHNISFDPDTLSHACMANQYVTAKFLLDYGFDPNKMSYNKNEIIFRSKFEIIQLLIDYGMIIEGCDILNAISNETGDERIFYLIHDKGNFLSEELFNYVPIIGKSKCSRKIFEFLLKKYDELIDDRVTIELYGGAFHIECIELIDLLLEYRRLPEDIINGFYNRRMSSKFIYHMQSKGYFLDLDN